MKSKVSTKAFRPAFTAAALAAAALVIPPVARASFLPPEMMDTAAMGLAWLVICAVPIGGIVLFWLVHVLPERIAHKRHHPQKDAIHTLCLLSLVFGGLLWPIAWLWAYTKPVGHQLAYGTDKHDDYFHETGERAGGRARRPRDRQPPRRARRNGETRGAPAEARDAARRPRGSRGGGGASESRGGAS